MYKPIQFAATNKNHKELHYKELLPSKELSNYISCYWTLKSDCFLIDGAEHKILPDGCVDIIFDFEDKISMISGIMNKSEKMILFGNQKKLGIRFLPKAIPFIIKSNANELLNSVIETELICKELKTMVIRVLESKNEENIFNSIDEELKKFFYDYKANEKFLNILNIILLNKGTLKVEELSNITNISEKQILRYFQSYIGISTKEFSNIIRFQNTLNSFENNKKNSKDFFDFGYYDQSHMINNLKKYL